MIDSTENKLVIWFWQQMVSPHMVALADSLASAGADVIFVANEMISDERAMQGWVVPKLGKVKIVIARDRSAISKIILYAPKNSIHICQGFRGNGLVHDARKLLHKCGLRQWVIMEKVDDYGFLGLIKRVVYRILFLLNEKKVDGILAIGEGTVDWIIKQGFSKDKIYSYAYFLKDHHEIQEVTKNNIIEKSRPFRFVYAGQLIERKCVDLLISSIAALDKSDIELWIFGRGAIESCLKDLASKKLSNQVRWFGTHSMTEVRSFMSKADCLVLPSRHDGWGAVVSEALMAGTPVICSSACGASIVVRASGVGAVFSVGNISELTIALMSQYAFGKWITPERIKLAEWAKCLGADSGAEYLTRIFAYHYKKIGYSSPPWNKFNEFKCRIAK